MTEIESAKKAPPRSLPAPESATATERPAPMARLVGLDLARALAVFGMFAVHVGPFPTPGGGVGDWILGLASGRVSALFAKRRQTSVTFCAQRRGSSVRITRTR
ncbi:hypothetical protein [Streptomyces sp. NPDC002845]